MKFTGQLRSFESFSQPLSSNHLNPPKIRPTETSSGSCSNEPLRLWEHGRTLPWVARHCATSISSRRSLYRCEEWRQLSCQGRWGVERNHPRGDWMMLDPWVVLKFYLFKLTVVSQALQKCWRGCCWYFTTWCCFKGWANDEVVGVNDPTSDIGWPLPKYWSNFLQVEAPSRLIDQPTNAQMFILLGVVLYASPTFKLVH